MATYDNPIHECYTLGLIDLGVAEIHSYKGPAGYKGKLTHIGIGITETVVGTTSGPEIRVGTAADNDAFGALIIPDATADEVYWSEADDTDAILDADIPADTLIEINQVIPVGGSIAGQGFAVLRFEWYK